MEFIKLFTELIKKFGVEPVLLIAQVVNFLIVLFILKRFLYKPILELLKKRQDSVKEGIKQTEEAQRRLDKALSEEKNVLKNAQARAKKLIDDAVLESKEAAKEIEKDSRRNADKILKEAQLQIERTALKTEKRLTQNITSLALKLLEKSASQLFTQNEQKEVLQHALKKLKQ